MAEEVRGRFDKGPNGELRDAGEGNVWVFKDGTRLRRPAGNPSGQSQSSSSSNNNSSNNNIDQQFRDLPSLEDFIREQQRQQEERLKQFVDPVLTNQKQLVEQLMGRSDLEEFNQSLRQEKGIGQTEALLKGLTEQSLDVEGLLKGLPEDVQKRTAGTFTTEAQRRRIEAKERDPLTDQLSELLRGQERAGAGLSTSLQAIQDALNLRVTQEGREIEPIREALNFSGFNLNNARQDEVARLNALISGFSQDQSNDLSRIQANIQSGENQRSREHDVRLLELQSQMQAQQELQSQILEGVNDADQNFLVQSATDLADRGVSVTEISRILQGAKPNVPANQIKALVQLATQGGGLAGGGGSAGKATGTSGNNASSNSLNNSLNALVRGENVPGLQRLPSGGQSVSPVSSSGSSGRQPLF